MSVFAFGVLIEGRDNPLFDLLGIADRTVLVLERSVFLRICHITNQLVVRACCGHFIPGFVEGRRHTLSQMVQHLCCFGRSCNVPLPAGYERFAFSQIILEWLSHAKMEKGLEFLVHGLPLFFRDCLPHTKNGHATGCWGSRQINSTTPEETIEEWVSRHIPIAATDSLPRLTVIRDMPR